jgi:hypothetical protein
MRLLEHLDKIDDLVSKGEAPPKIRGRILNLREQLEAVQRDFKNVSNYKQQNRRLRRKIKELRDDKKRRDSQDAKAVSGWQQPSA